MALTRLPSRYGRAAAIVLIVLWSAFPIYWTLNTSLMTNTQAQSAPAHYLPLPPTGANYATIFGLQSDPLNPSSNLWPQLSRSILNITAISAIQPIPGFALAVSTWAGVIGYAKTLSLPLGAHVSNVNTICPGYIDTSRLRKVFAAGDEGSASVQQRLRAEVPLGRIGTVDDIANLVALLVSPKGSYVTGTAIQVDGGLLRATR